MKQSIVIKLDRGEWLQAVADYLKIDTEDIDSMDHSTMEVIINKPLTNLK